ncbi:hypothetical protein NGRA_0055 [Nosema granulosis]|uniref:Uncharacterized protein n=1 Tax=Nosema granulosis TaxID=83296 RepID=A0A9P6H138_9MICR|nr:hypothetical protein NGRA_0055 [Nosema granulosis]
MYLILAYVIQLICAMDIEHDNSYTFWIVGDKRIENVMIESSKNEYDIKFEQNKKVSNRLKRTTFLNNTILPLSYRISVTKIDRSSNFSTTLRFIGEKETTLFYCVLSSKSEDLYFWKDFKDRTIKIETIGNKFTQDDSNVLIVNIMDLSNEESKKFVSDAIYSNVRWFMNYFAKNIDSYKTKKKKFFETIKRITFSEDSYMILKHVFDINWAILEYIRSNMKVGSKHDSQLKNKHRNKFNINVFNYISGIKKTSMRKASIKKNEKYFSISTISNHSQDNLDEGKKRLETIFEEDENNSEKKDPVVRKIVPRGKPDKYLFMKKYRDELMDHYRTVIKQYFVRYLKLNDLSFIISQERDTEDIEITKENEKILAEKIFSTIAGANISRDEFKMVLKKQDGLKFLKIIKDLELAMVSVSNMLKNIEDFIEKYKGELKNDSGLDTFVEELKNDFKKCKDCLEKWKKISNFYKKQDIETVEDLIDKVLPENNYISEDAKKQVNFVPEENIIVDNNTRGLSFSVLIFHLIMAIVGICLFLYFYKRFKTSSS